MMAEERVAALIAGAGFVGSYVLAELACAGISVCGADLRPRGLARQLSGEHAVKIYRSDLSDPNSLRSLLARESPRRLVIASQLGCGPDALVSLQNLVDLAAATNVEQVIFISSLAVYGSASRPGGLLETSSPVDPSPYGLQKLAEEEAVLVAARKRDIPCLMLRSSGLFGRLPAPRSSNRSAGAIDRVIRQYIAGERPTLTIEDTSDHYLYSRELGSIIVEAITRPPEFEIMNVGPGHVLDPDKIRSVLEAALSTHVALRRCPRTGPAIEALNVDKLDSWFSDRARARSEAFQGVIATMRDFGITAPQ